MTLRSLFAILATLCLGGTASGQSASTPDTTGDRSTLNQLPVRFEPAGQEGTFLARGIGSAVRLNGRSIDFPVSGDAARHDSIRVEFVGAHKSSRVIGVDQLPGRVNYLYGDDSARWRTNVRTFARAQTPSLYRGIDVVYYSAGDQLEYDLIVGPRGRPDSIRLAVNGAPVAISDAGDLVYGRENRVLLRKPIAYQIVDGVRCDVEVAYRLRGQMVGFAVGRYDRRQPLVIDPVVVYSFSFGGSGDEQVYDIATDETGAVYVGGETSSVDFPTVNGAQPRQDAGNTCNFYGVANSICRDAFLAKLAADGKSLEYATYFGSAAFDQVNHIAVDASHALYFAGWTTTETTSPQPDVRNSFIGKLAPDGSHFVYTYFTPRCCVSGPQLTINDLAIGADGSAYVVTSTPTASEVAVLSPAGTNYHSIFTLTDPSGVRRTTFNSIAVRGDSVFVGGDTTWSAFPTTVPSLFFGIRDGVIMRMALDGTLAYSTLVGTDGGETVADVAPDQNGFVYAVGGWSEADSTCSPTSMTHHAVVLTLLSPDGAWLGAEGFLYPFDTCLLPPVRIALDDRGNAHFVLCGYGTDPGTTVSRSSCVLWKIRATNDTLFDDWGVYFRRFSDVPSLLFAIDSAGTNRWFAPVTGQVSFAKLISQFTLRSLGSSASSPAHFGSPIALLPDVSTDDDLEVSYRRYDPGVGWTELQGFSPYRDFYNFFVWTPAYWEVGDHIVCVDVRLAGTADTPQSACLNFTITGLAPGEPPVVAPAADFNADQRPDLIWNNSATGQLAMWNVGGGEHGEHVLGGGYLTGAALPAGWRVAGAGDIDGDGHTDLVLQSDTGLLGAWFFNGSTLRNGITLTPGQVGDPNWQIRAVGDLNHDGHPDLIWQYAPTGQVAFWLMNGTNAIAYIVPNVDAPGGDWEIVGTGDSNRDGERDIFWQQRSTGTLAVWWMNGTSIAGASLLSASPDPKWRVVAVADLDGDAYSDLVLEHTDTRTVAAWYLQHQTVRFGLMLNPATVGDPGWKIAGPR